VRVPVKFKPRVAVFQGECKQEVRQELYGIFHFCSKCNREHVFFLKSCARHGWKELKDKPKVGGKKHD
jgi:hypothetical protein